MKPLSAKKEDESAISRRSMQKIAEDNDAEWTSNRTGKPNGKPEPAKKSAAVRTATATPKGKSARAMKGPEPKFIEPMKPKLVAALPTGSEWSYEIKWDGYRALLIKHGESAKLLSRNDNSLLDDFPSIGEAAKEMAADSLLVDGEIVALDPKGKPAFQELQNRATTTAAIVYYAFDLLALEGEDLTDRPLSERRTLLAQQMAGTVIRLSPDLPGTPDDVIPAVAKLGLEGIVAKRKDSVYISGDRSNAWQKVRLRRGQEFVIGGYRPGMNPFESILVGYYEGRKLMFAGKVRPGFTPRTRQMVWDLIRKDEVTQCPFANLPDTDKKGRWGEGITAEEMKELRWVKPRHIVAIDFVEWTRHRHLRHASFQGIRTDKKPTEVVREEPATQGRSQTVP